MPLLQAAPTISVTSPLKHAKIDAAGHVTLPSLSLWNAQTSKLADVVEEAYSMVSSKAIRNPAAFASD